MMKLFRLALIATLAFGTTVASAVPLKVEVSTFGIGSAGSWSLVGNTPGAGSWSHSFLDSSTWNLNILAGEYDWYLNGGGQTSLVSWSLSLNGHVVDSGHTGSWKKFSIKDDSSFTAVGVPEPATLGLLGLGLAALGLSRRRKA